MGEIHTLPDPEATEREASDWFARLNADDASAADHAHFQSWLRAHPCNEKAYAELVSTWSLLVESGPLVRAVQFGHTMNAATAKPAVRTTPWLAGIAATVIVTLALGITWRWYTQNEHTRFQTAIGEQVAVALPDGSSINLNTNSSVEVDYTRATRVIHLERGEAYFSVAHDKQRPFWVHAGSHWVRAVGTAFNVYLKPAGVQVTVSEGTVNLVNAARSDESPPTESTSSGRSVAAVTAGEQADARGRADVIRALNTAQLNRLLAWRNSTLYFQDEPLGNVVDELMRYTTLKIEIVDDALREVPVGGTFQTNPDGAEALLTLLQDGFGARIRRAGANEVYVSGPGE